MTQSRLHRWSKQKIQAQEEVSKPDSPQTHETPDSQAITHSEENDESRADKETEENTPVELPPLESLNDDSDYSMFMSSEVDEKIKKVALRRLFKAAIFNVRDGLNDYDEDFTTFEELGDIVTSDMKYHAERKKAEEEARRQLEAESQSTEEPQEIETMASKDDEADDSRETLDSEEPEDESEVAGQSDLPQPDNRSTT